LNALEGVAVARVAFTIKADAPAAAVAPTLKSQTLLSLQMLRFHFLLVQPGRAGIKQVERTVEILGLMAQIWPHLVLAQRVAKVRLA
jgi:hypothetical protein